MCIRSHICHDNHPPISYHILPKHAMQTSSPPDHPVQSSPPPSLLRPSNHLLHNVEKLTAHPSATNYWPSPPQTPSATHPPPGTSAPASSTPSSLSPPPALLHPLSAPLGPLRRTVLHRTRYRAVDRHCSHHPAPVPSPHSPYPIPAGSTSAPARTSLSLSFSVFPGPWPSFARVSSGSWRAVSLLWQVAASGLHQPSSACFSAPRS